MRSPLGLMRQLVLAPDLSSVTFAERGFAGATAPSARRLEAIPQAVVCGFDWGISARTLWDVERRLELVEQEQRGFAYEGATMAFTVRDAMKGGRGTRTRELLLGPGQKHLLLAYIGIGFAMARLPRPLWRRIVPDLTGSRYYPTMSWLAVDGYGFDLAYFHTDRYVDEQQRPPAYPWEGSPDYFPRAVDQGIGRALWFMQGAQPADVAAAVGKFGAERHADLWSGVGLAATFAGGCDAEGLAEVRDAAGEHAAQVGLGSVFAITAREYAGHVPEHSRIATEVLAGVPVAAAVAIADRTESEVDAEGSGPGDEPLYERWRDRIRTELTAEQHRNTRAR